MSEETILIEKRKLELERLVSEYIEISKIVAKAKSSMKIDLT